MTSRILVALDGSPISSRVLSSALELGVPIGAGIRLFRAVAVPPEFPAAARASHHDSLEDHMLAEARSGLAQLGEGAPRLSSVPWDLEVVVGSTPAKAILEAASRFGADLIVMGSHGYSAFDALLGTTAAAVVNRARCNVLVVHAPGAETPTR